MAINLSWNSFKENKEYQSLTINEEIKWASNLPLFRLPLFGNTTYWNLKIYRLSAYPNQSTCWNGQIEKISIVYTHNKLHHIRINPNLMNQPIKCIFECFIAVALIIRQIGTCNGSFDDAPLLSSLTDRNLTTKKETRTSIIVFFLWSS